jgi:hypothetical protein
MPRSKIKCPVRGRPSPTPARPHTRDYQTNPIPPPTHTNQSTCALENEPGFEPKPPGTRPPALSPHPPIGDFGARL